MESLIDISINLSPDSKDERKSFRCPQCKYVTDRKNNLKRHIITMHQESSKSVECCGVIFKSKASLRDHVCLFHRGGYCCQICGRNFCRKALLHRHLTVHSGQKDYSCHLCGYATSHKSNLERHQKVHLRSSNENFALSEDLSPNDDHQRAVTLKDIPAPRLPRLKQLKRSPRCYLLLPKRLSETYGKSPVVSCPNEIAVNDKGNQMEERMDNKLMDSDSLKSDIQLEYPDKDLKQIRHTKNRMYGNSYKCSECKQRFTHQRELFTHKCTPSVQCQPSLPIVTAVQKGTIKQMLSATELYPDSSDNIKGGVQFPHSGSAQNYYRTYKGSPESKVSVAKKNKTNCDNSGMSETNMSICQTKNTVTCLGQMNETRKRKNPVDNCPDPFSRKYRCLDNSFEFDEFSRARNLLSPTVKPRFGPELLSYFDCTQTLSKINSRSVFENVVSKKKIETIAESFSPKSTGNSGNISSEYEHFMRKKSPMMPPVLQDFQYRPPEKKLGIWRVW
ncbi:hypothetical protein SNE40_001323 [Patella caerulea]|uniref:C2H2-type domain-containing protein n=1 Tax=Patella caerulea TaxID=87958 RepID=A0AAN8Q806_PATCE